MLTFARWSRATKKRIWKYLSEKNIVFSTDCNINDTHLVTIILNIWWWQLPQQMPDDPLLPYLFGGNTPSEKVYTCDKLFRYFNYTADLFSDNNLDLQLPQSNDSVHPYLCWQKILQSLEFFRYLEHLGGNSIFKWEWRSFCRTRIPVSNTVTALEVWFHLITIEISYLEYELHHHLSYPIWIRRLNLFPAFLLTFIIFLLLS